MKKLMLCVLCLGFLVPANAEDKDSKDDEFRDPRTHERTLMQEELELLRLKILASQPLILPGVPSTPRCEVRREY